MITSQPDVRIDYFSDVLCIWAYLAEVKVRELHRNLPQALVVPRYVSIFGDVARKMQSWDDRGGLQGYHEHVVQVAGSFGYEKLSAKVWHTAPSSSMPAHLWLTAVRLHAAEICPSEVDSHALVSQAAWALRKAFFLEDLNIAQRQDIVQVLRGCDLDTDRLTTLIDTGAGHAELEHDRKEAEKFAVTGSPTFVLNEGRQKLYGNVGYKIIEANVREVLERPMSGASWC